MTSLEDARTSTKGRRSAVAFCTLALFAALLGSTAPSPLYPIYAARWSLGQASISAVFAFYAVGTLASLLIVRTVGDRFSDRRILLLPGLLLIGVAAVFMSSAASPLWLFVGRLIAGAGTGIVAAVVPASIHDLLGKNSGKKTAVLATLAFTAGATVGPLTASAAIAMGIFPTVLPYLIIFLCSGVASVGLIVSSWGAREKGWDLTKRAEVSSPEQSRENALRVSSQILPGLTIAVAWAIGSAFMAIGTKLALDLYRLESVAIAGLLPAIFQLCGGIGQIVFTGMSMRSVALLGLAGLGAVQVLLWVAAIEPSAGLLVLGIPLYGLFYGAAYVAAVGLTTESAPAGRQSTAISHLLIIGYLANAVPTFCLGALIDGVGVSEAFSVFSAAVLVACGVGAVLATSPRTRK